MKKNIFISVMIMILCLFSLTAVGEENLNLEKALQLGLKYNIQINNSKLDYEIAENDYKIARQGLNPQISLESSYTRMEEGPMQIDRTNPPEFLSEGPKDNYSTNINIQQPIYAGGRIRLGIEQAEEGKKLTRIQNLKTQNETLFQIIQAYYNVLMARDRVKIEKDSLTLVKEHKRIAESSLKAGSAIRTDVLQAEIEESKAKQRLLEAQNQLKLAKRRLGNLIGLQKEYNIEIPKRQPEIKLNFENLYQKALENRPEIRSIDINQKLTKTKLELEEKSNYPSFALRGNYGWQGSDFSLKDGSWSITVSGSMFLYQGGKSKTKQDKTKNQLTKLKESEKNLIQMVELEVEQKIMEIKENQQNIEIHQLNLQKARENLDLENKRFKTGVGKSVDVLNAQTTLIQTRIAASQAEYKYEKSLYDLLLKIGNLKDYVKEVIENENNEK